MAETKTTTGTQAPPIDMREQGMPQGQAPSERRTYETAVQRRNREAGEKRNAFAEAAVSYRHEIEAALKPWGVSFDFFLAGLRIGLDNTLKNDPDFFDKASPQSFLEQVMKAARVGLICDGVEAAIGRYADSAAFMPMVQGYVKILDSTGTIKDINHGVVIKGDDFDFQEGDGGYIVHKPSLTRDTNGEAIGAWCIVNTVAGGRYAEVVGAVDLKKIAATSRAKSGPRGTWSAEMHRKAPFRRLYKRLPKTPRMELALRYDNENYTTVIHAEGRPASRVPTNALFADKAHREEPEAVTGDLDPRDLPDASQSEGPSTPSEGRGPQSEAASEPTEDKPPDVDPDILRSLRHVVERTEDEEGLSDAVETVKGSPHWPKMDKPTRAGFERLFEQQRAKIGQPPQLRAITSSTQKEPKVYADGKEWAGDIITKLASLKDEAPLHAWWGKNLAFIEQARTINPAEAERVIHACAARGLKLEGDDGAQA